MDIDFITGLILTVNVGWIWIGTTFISMKKKKAHEKSVWVDFSCDLLNTHTTLSSAERVPSLKLKQADLASKFSNFLRVLVSLWDNRSGCVYECLNLTRGMAVFMAGFIDVYQGWIDQRLPHDRRSITHQIKDGNPLIKLKEREGKKPALTRFSPPSFPVNYSSLLTLEPQKLPFIPITCHLVYLIILKRTFTAKEDNKIISKWYKYLRSKDTF